MSYQATNINRNGVIGTDNASEELREGSESDGRARGSRPLRSRTWRAIHCLLCDMRVRGEGRDRSLWGRGLLAVQRLRRGDGPLRSYIGNIFPRALGRARRYQDTNTDPEAPQ